jgi:bifunctional DNA-binding transcriptional regulator/antitoxin component of YhaV-PrlF toxin-antitoxin module
MRKSTLTGKYQTTVPKEVREKLGARPGYVLPLRSSPFREASKSVLGIPGRMYTVHKVRELMEPSESIDQTVGG